MSISRKKFIEKLVEVVNRELELAENGIVRVPDARFVTFPPEHRIIEELLKLLGYGGKTIYVHVDKEEEPEAIKAIILSDYQRGTNIFHKYYLFLLEAKLQKLGIEVSKKRLKRILWKLRRELRSESKKTEAPDTT
ncbi:hypothetical protein Theam_1743 (plasmid) [Thermovibrio ammonificans HB-1]|uniref:Uncharacterized protein n=1 Tax=Thermovibrio ammonificans (strain DSM 15698 / JCM 12110 / HB-1) TaxID=648996 RepID=E8T6X8_THEA1|nr:hypothetical protein [Thermovibrio ammonificans]ADU97699.1 hypothetical protein Theam_1743 [Thermovibrio ammonificans HB-1]